MHLAILADDAPITIGQDRGVEVAAVGRQLRVAKRNTDVVLRCRLKQWARRRVRHFALEPGVYLALVRHVPARKEGGEGKLRIDDEIALGCGGLRQNVRHAANDDLPAVGLLRW